MNIRLYCGINEVKWNHHPVNPGPFACIAPVYGKTERTRRENIIVIPKDVAVLQDSGAFSDGPNFRLSFDDAYQRQQAHAQKYGYAGQVTHLASYDLLIDERWKNGARFKERWDETAAGYAVEHTIQAARWLSAHRNGKGLVLSAQGVTPQQYLACTQEILPLLAEGDILGLGGWCITGKKRAVMMPLLAETLALIMPEVLKAGIKHIHIWGVMLAQALAELGAWTVSTSIQISTDSSGPTTRPAFGIWGYADWIDKTYKRAPVQTRGIDRALHVIAVREWLTGFEWCKYLNPKYSKVHCMEKEYND